MESSKKWKFDCHCGKTSSIWDIGGIRGAAKGKSLTGIKCPHCKRFAMQKLYKEE
ncbi:MAG TPA: hypothetical protein VK177_03975 [Flavobacteriales bacterium]|nr:hypothetical protein [Flavobacteriales bacterium]